MSPRRDGFALVLVIVVLGLLVLVVYALAALGRVDAQIAATAAARGQARQHALTGLELALGQLQQFAGPDDRLTGMAGMAGLAPGHATRHWAGVWSGDGTWLAWLTSGDEGTTPVAPEGADTVVLVGAGSVGASASEQEHVRVRLVPVPAALPGGASRGHLAWWIGDEGVKLSARIPAEDEPAPGARHAVDELLPTLDPASPALARLLVSEQLAHLPGTPPSAGAVRARFHSLGRTHAGLERSPGGVRLRAGALNVNTTSRDFWRGVAATYNRDRPPARQLAISPAALADRLGTGLAAATGPGKRAGGPFTTVDAFLESALLATALQGSGVSPLEFRDGLAPWLTVRSDTFRLRAYGETRNPAEPATVVAAAWCEALVQRQPEEFPGAGRRFIVLGFRWLGPDDI